MSHFHLTSLVGASPAHVYRTWLDSRRLSEFTGMPAYVDPSPGGVLAALHDYIDGRILSLKPYGQIVMTLRTPEMSVRCADSLAALILRPAGLGLTHLTVEHAQVPDDLMKTYIKMWREQFLEPLRRYVSEDAPVAVPQWAARYGLLPAG